MNLRRLLLFTHSFGLTVLLSSSGCSKQQEMASKPSMLREIEIITDDEDIEDFEDFIKTKPTLDTANPVDASTPESTTPEALVADEKTLKNPVEKDAQMLSDASHTTMQAVDHSTLYKSEAMDQANEKQHTFAFGVENKTGKALYAACFAYLKHRRTGPWRWHKTKTYEIPNDQTETIQVHSLGDKKDIANVYGCLGVFDTKQQADDTTYELLPDHSKLDLDLLCELANMNVCIRIEKYGNTESFYTYDFIEQLNKHKTARFNFTLRNDTNATIHTCCYTYEDRTMEELILKGDPTTISSCLWRFYKTDVITIKPGTEHLFIFPFIPGDPANNRARGYLAVYNEDEHDLAEKDTFETMAHSKRLRLGLLSRRVSSTIAITSEKYGTENILDFSVVK